MQYLSKRRSIANLIADLLVEALGGYAKKKRKYLQFVLSPILQSFFALQPAWKCEKTTGVAIMRKVREAILKFPFHLTKKSNIEMIFQHHCLSHFFKLGNFLASKIITIDDVMKTILPNAIKKDLELPLRQTRFVKLIIPHMITGGNEAENHFFRVLQSISETQPEHPLAFVYPKFVSLLEEYFFKEFQDGHYDFLFQLVRNQLHTPQYVNAYNIQSYTLHFSFDFVMDFLTKLIRTTIDQKAEIAKVNPERYTQQMTAIFEALLLQNRWKDSYELWTQSTLPFFLFPPELRDEIIAEVMCDPTGVKMLSNVLAKEVTTVSLSISLLFDDFRKMIASIAKNTLNKTDEYGFQDKVQFNFQPSLTQESRKAEEFNGKVHIFERFLFPMLRHKNLQIVQKAYRLYISFTKKILSTAIRLNKSNLYELAIGVHARLCRFLNSKVNASLQDFVIRLYCDQIVSPQSLYVGLKTNKKYDETIFAAILKIPYTTETIPIPLVSIISQLLRYSHCEALPGIGELAATLSSKLLATIYNGISASFTFPPFNSFYKTQVCNILNMPPTDAYINSVRILRNAQAKLRLPEKFATKFFNKYLTPKLSSLNLSTITNTFIDHSLITPQLVESFKSIQIGAGAEPFIATIDFLSKKIAEYDPHDFKRPSTSLINTLIQILREIGFPKQITLNRTLPVVPFNYERTNTEQQYRKTVSKYFTIQFTVHHSIASIVSFLVPKDSFFYRLFTANNLNFPQIDEALSFVPLTPEQADKEKINPSKKKHISTEVVIQPLPDPAVLLRLQNNDQKPKPKKPACPRCGHRDDTTHIKNRQGIGHPRPTQQNNQNRRKFTSHEIWIDTISWDIMRPLLKADSIRLCEESKNDGEFLFPIIKFIYFNMKKNSRCEENLNFVANLLNLCFNDILVEDPEPSEKNRNPKPMPTLFMDSDGTIRDVLSPFVIKKKGKKKACPIKNKSPAGQAGKKQYQSTKVLIAYLCSILGFETTKEKVDVSIFAKSLIDVLSLPSATLKKKIGDDNHSFYADHLSAALLNHINFGTTLKETTWAQKIESPLLEPFFRLFTCDSIHHHSLEYVNQLLLQTTSYDEKRAIITAFISFFTVYSTWNFTMHTRTRLVAWALDYRYVGFPIPKFTFDFIHLIIQDKKLHNDVRRSIASNIVAFFKWKSLNNAGTEQFEELFEILKIIYDGARVSMAPTFCQLVRPKYCQVLSKTSPVYKALMPSTSLPTSFVTPMNWERNTRLSMPHTGEWEEPHRKFVSYFVGGALLLKDENVIQLAIQLLTKLKIRGGETAQKIAPFIKDALSIFNVQLPSAILINFIHNFVIASPHAQFDGLVDLFVSIFRKTREALDVINQEQMKLYWTRDPNYNQNAYAPINKLCGIFSGCIENRINEISDKDDYKLAKLIAEKVVVALKGDKELQVYYEPFNQLVHNWQLLTNDHLINALSAPLPSEDALNNILLFITEEANNFVKTSYPSYVRSAFNKNKVYITLKILRENLSTWPVEIAQNPQVKTFVRPLFDEIAIQLGRNNEEFNALLPQLWQFADLNTSSFGYASNYSCCARGGSSIGYASTLETSFDHKMMLSNCMMSQRAAPMAGAALGMERAAALNDIPQDAEESDEMAEGLGLAALF